MVFIKAYNAGDKLFKWMQNNATVATDLEFAQVLFDEDDNVAPENVSDYIKMEMEIENGSDGNTEFIDDDLEVIN